MNKEYLQMTSTHAEKIMRNNEILARYRQDIFEKGGNLKIFLDLSCGYRTDVREVVEGMGHKWVGVDIIDQHDVIKADAHFLCFKNEIFDVVYSAATFEHYQNPWEVAQEVFRVLKRGGGVLWVGCFSATVAWPFILPYVAFRSKTHASSMRI